MNVEEMKARLRALLHQRDMLRLEHIIEMITQRTNAFFMLDLLEDRNNRRTKSSPPEIIKGGCNQYRNEAFAQPQIPSYRT